MQAEIKKNKAHDHEHRDEHRQFSGERGIVQMAARLKTLAGPLLFSAHGLPPLFCFGDKPAASHN